MRGLFECFLFCSVSYISFFMLLLVGFCVALFEFVKKNFLFSFHSFLFPPSRMMVGDAISRQMKAPCHLNWNVRHQNFRLSGVFVLESSDAGGCIFQGYLEWFICKLRFSLLISVI